ncbi:7-deoxyloganetin glucosyltransferase-like [Oryza glaberrima]|uniref:Glycosyltransferase n=1 Tax=Oryza glaberrima TaxID=4538 RepID=I1PK54_ORYGL|nr:7-deoxyloganetin glucosyltransferase-like [Oryza glaberrima]
MGSFPAAEETTATAAARPHAVMVPYPAQGHVTPMLKLAVLLHARGFHVTFVNNEFNHRRLLRARGAGALDGAPGFRFAAIDDGLPPSDADATQDVPALCHSVRTTCLPRFKALLAKLDEEADADAGAGAGDARRVTCVVADSTMAFAILAARELGLRCATLWTASACGFMGYYHYKHLLDRGLFPLKSEADLSNGHLDTKMDWIPGMPADLRLRDLPSFVRSTDRDDIMFNFFIDVTATMPLASAVILNTFDELDAPLMVAMSALLPPIYTVGPLHLTARNNLPADSPVAGVGSNLWKEQGEALRWLDGRPPRSVVYVNFGSITVMSAEHLLEFAWGLAGSGYAFLWNVRPDLVKGDAAALPPEFAAATGERSMLTTWCPQAEVLEHEAVGVFLTHSGWNSTLESIVGGVPMVCWPFFAEQQTNCRYKRTEWGIGAEIPDDVRRGEVEALIREAMDGEKGREMRRRVAELRESAVASGQQGGRSMQNLDRLIDEVLLA